MVVSQANLYKHQGLETIASYLLYRQVQVT